MDIHPDGSRFATGGQGDGDGSGKVMIWNMKPFEDESVECSDDCPKILCNMESHQGLHFFD